MKTLYKYFYILLCMPLCLISCSDDEQKEVQPEDEGVVSKLDIIKNVDTYSSEGGTQELEFAASHNWTVKAEQSWCKVSPASGAPGKRSVNVTVEVNESGDERDSKVTLKSGTVEKVITVVQKQKDALLLTAAKVDVPADGKSISVEVKSNMAFEYVIDEAAKEWITPEESRGMKTTVVAFKVNKNEEVEKREGKIYFVAGNLKEVFTVYQKGDDPRLVLDKKEYVIDYKAQDVTINLMANIPNFEIIPLNETWLSVNESRAMSSYKRVISVKENIGEQRSAVIKFVCGEQTDSVTIIQKQKDVIALLSKDTCYIEAKGGALCFDVSTNVDITAKISATWITLVPQSRRMVEKRLCFQVENNVSLNERQAEIILEGGQAKQTILVIQKGQKEEGGITILNELETFKQAAGEQTLKIRATAKWKVDIDQPWCTISPAQGNAGEYLLTVKVTENETYDERNTGLTFSSGVKEQRLTVIQKQKDALLLTSNSKQVSATGGIVSVNTQSNINYKFDIDKEAASWITPAESRGLIEDTHQFNVAENITNQSREGKIVFYADNGIKETFTVYQDKGEGIQIVLSRKLFVLGSSEQDIKIDVQHNTTYRMEMPSVDWLHERVTKSMSTYTHYITVDANETTDERSAKIKFISGNLIEEVEVIQKPKDALIIANDTVRVEATGGNLKFDVQTNVDLSVESSVEWIKQIPKSKTLRTETLEFIVQENVVTEERLGEIIVTAGSLKQKIVVVQKAHVVTEGLEILSNLETYPSDGGSQIVKIKSSGDWTIQSEQTWCKVEPSSGNPEDNQIKVTVDANTSYDERDAALIIKTGSIEKRITVTQKQKDALMITSKAQTEVTADGGEFSVDLRSNVTYTYTISTEAESWITALDSRGLTDSSCRFKVSPNPNLKKREGKIEFVGGGITEVFTVYQDGETPQLVLTQTEYNLEAAQTEIKISLKTNSKYEMVLPAVGWMRERVSRTMSSYTRYITIDENTTTDDRSAKIEFKYEGRTEVVTVNQKAKSALLLKKTTYEVESIGGNLNINFESNVDYDITTSVEWIKKISNSRAMTAKTVSFTIDENTASTERTGEIIFKRGADEQKVTVIQNGKTVTGKFVMKHSRVQCHVPRFTDKVKVTGSIDWGDKSTSDYVEGITHTYSNPGTYEVVIQLDKVTKLELNDIDGIDLIDLSLF